MFLLKVGEGNERLALPLRRSLADVWSREECCSVVTLLPGMPELLVSHLRNGQERSLLGDASSGMHDVTYLVEGSVFIGFQLSTYQLCNVFS